MWNVSNIHTWPSLGMWPCDETRYGCHLKMWERVLVYSVDQILIKFLLFTFEGLVVFLEHLFVTYVLSLTFKGTSWAESHTNSFLRPERHYSQDSLSFVGKRVARIFALLFETLCFRLCLGHILKLILWSLKVLIIIG